MHIVNLGLGTSLLFKILQHERVLPLIVCCSKPLVSHKAVSVPAKSTFPSPQVGSAAATLGGKIYMYLGRGGVSMAPVEENGSLIVFDPVTLSRSILSPVDEKAPYSEAKIITALQLMEVTRSTFMQDVLKRDGRPTCGLSECPKDCGRNSHQRLIYLEEVHPLPSQRGCYFACTASTAKESRVVL